MIEVFKLLGGWEKIDYRQFFSLATNLYNTTGHSQRLYIGPYREVIQGCVSLSPIESYPRPIRWYNRRHSTKDRRFTVFARTTYRLTTIQHDWHTTVHYDFF